MYVSARWTGNRLRSAVRLFLGILLIADTVVPDIIDVPPVDLVPYYVFGTIVWALLLVTVLWTLVEGRFAGRVWVEVLGSVALLAGAFIARFGLLGVWSDDAAVTGCIVFYLVELRGIIRSSPALYAALALAGVVFLAAVSMADAEEKQPGATINTAGKALIWGVGQVLRFGTLVNEKPTTSAGEFLGILVILSGALFAAVLISSITAWAVRQNDKAHSANTVRQQVMEALIEAGLATEPHPLPDSTAESRVFVDVDHFVGSQPRNWFRSRVLASSDALNALRDGAIAPILESDSRPRDLVAVLEGPSATFADAEYDDEWDFVRIDSGATADEWILKHATVGDVVVTGDAHLQRNLDKKGIPFLAWSSAGARSDRSASGPV